MPGASVRVLSNAGFELGAHTLSHIPLSGIEAGKLKTEVLGSKIALEDMTGTRREECSVIQRADSTGTRCGAFANPASQEPAPQEFW